MPYYLGIDGGATMTVAVLIDENGGVRATGKAGAISFPQYGKEAALSVIADLANQMAQGRKIRSLCAGLSGLNRQTDIAGMNSALKVLQLADHVEAVSEGLIALYGATIGKPGVILIAGTEVVAWGTDGRNFKRADGWGYFLGDNGGGIDLSRSALVAAFKSYDGRGKRTRLVEAMLEYFNANSPEEVVEKVYGKPVTIVAGFAPYVFREAIFGDEVALDLVRGAAKELSSSVKAVIDSLKLSSPPIFAYGGLLQNQLLKVEVEKELGVTLLPPKFQPVIGAAIRAVSSAGELSEELLKNLPSNGTE
ncbi:MAG: N-acetylglucosamine kinase [Thermoprotei archaeon]